MLNVSNEYRAYNADNLEEKGYLIKKNAVVGFFGNENNIRHI
jgi:hypothetical protein